MQVYIPKKISYDVIEWCKKGRGDEQIHRWSMNEVNKNFDGQKVGKKHALKLTRDKITQTEKPHNP